MLRSLRIHNYALIERLDLQFQGRFTAITGETGAGKSILLEALALVLGSRAHYQSIRYGEQKCSVELEATYDKDSIDPLLDAWELDKLDTVILRRELSASKRSRAFINDTPVTLAQLTEVGRGLVDLHGQQENIALQTSGYQIEQLDRFAKNGDRVNKYSDVFKKWKQLTREKAAMEAREEQLRKDKDYYQFQFNELEEARLEQEEYDTLEERLNELEHGEEIQEALSLSISTMDEEGVGVLSQLSRLEQMLGEVGRYSEGLQQLKDRMTSSTIELRDLLNELEAVAGKTEADPKQLGYLRDRMDTYNKLIHKHGLSDFSELVALRADFENKLKEAESFEEDQAALDKELARAFADVAKLGGELSKIRMDTSKKFGEQLTDQIRGLGMPKGCVRLDVSKREEPKQDGFDGVDFMFNANASKPLVPLAEVASGGEISRVMLAIKSLIRQDASDFTVIFDEIDTGVSGEVAAQIGKLMKSIGNHTQVIAVTHLPGVASKADTHLKVFKSDNKGKVTSNARYISEEERVAELASMFSGDAKSEAAMESARTMLSN